MLLFFRTKTLKDNLVVAVTKKSRRRKTPSADNSLLSASTFPPTNDRQWRAIAVADPMNFPPVSEKIFEGNLESYID